MAEETKTEETKEERKEETKTEEEKKEETTVGETTEEKDAFTKEKIYGIIAAIAGVAIIAAMALFYQDFWNLLVKVIIAAILVGAVALIIFGIIFAIYA
ncbi:MAG: hypothetical protein ACK4YO_01665 [Candidatus Altarchaeaceae archaeon]